VRCPPVPLILTGVVADLLGLHFSLSFALVLTGHASTDATSTLIIGLTLIYLLLAWFLGA
jgi:hypothetical protein